MTVQKSMDSFEFGTHTSERSEKVALRPGPKPEGHYSYNRPRALIETDLSSDHDPKAKQEREYWNRQHVFNVYT